MGALVRAAASADVVSVRELVGGLRAPAQGTQALSPAACAALIADDRSDLLVLDEDGALLGYALTLHVTVLRSAAPVGMLQEVVVDPARRRCGHGTRLVRAAIMRAWDAGCGEMVLATAGAGALYERLGFRRTAGYYKLTRTG